jgi:transmembrane sensor
VTEKTTNPPVDEPGFSHRDPVMDAALSWLFIMQEQPQDSTVIAEFEAWLAGSAEHRKTFERVASAWELPELDAAASELAARHGLSRAKEPRPGRAAPGSTLPRHRMRWATAIAATLIVGVGLARFPSLVVQWKADYITATGQTNRISLPDGSQLVINTDSAVKLDFEGNQRSVELLKGEAYFDVVPDPQHPFKVTGSYSEIVVKGTAFSVRKNDDEDIIVLEHGRVEVTKTPDRLLRAVLLPGESLHARAHDFSPVVKADTALALSWVKGQFSFKDQPLATVLAELGRYYPHTIITLNAELAATRVNGRYRLDNPELAIRSLVTAAGGTINRMPGGILILR